MAGETEKVREMLLDAAMQALGNYDGGKILFLGLGTGLGSTLIVDDVLAPMELGQLPYREGTFEDYVGLRELKKMGAEKMATSCGQRCGPADSRPPT
jgi:hypothetical protein